MNEIEGRKNVELVAEKNRIENGQIRNSEIPAWAKTVKGVADVKGEVEKPKAGGAWGKKQQAKASKDAAKESKSKAEELNDLLPPPPPPPAEEGGDEDDSYEDDFEDAAEPTSQHSRLAAVSDDLLSSSLSIVDANDDEVDGEDPSLFYTSVDCDAGIGDIFEKNAVKNNDKLIRKDDDVVEYGDIDDTTDESMYKKFVDDIAKNFVDNGCTDESVEDGDSIVRESISKDFLMMVKESKEKNASKGDAITATDDDHKEDEDEDFQPETSLRQEREALKLTEKKKATESALEKMNEQLSSMGILAMGTIELNIRPTTAQKKKQEEEVVAAVEEEAAAKVDDAAAVEVEEVKIDLDATISEQDETATKEHEQELDQDQVVKDVVAGVVDEVTAAPAAAILTVDTSIPEEEKNGNNMFLSPATTNGSPTNLSTDKSLLGLSFSVTGELPSNVVPDETAADQQAEPEADDFVHVSPTTSPAAEEPASLDSTPKPSLSPSGNQENEKGKENVNTQSMPEAPSKSPVKVDAPAAPMSASMSTLKRPPTEYKKTLTELNSVMSKAMQLYEELLEQSMQSGEADMLDVGSESLDSSMMFESCELLNSFRDSFASLHGKMSLLNEKDKTSTSMMRGSFAMPSILEDSVESFSSGSVKPPLPLMSQSISVSNSGDKTASASTKRPSTAPANERSEAEVLDSVLDKYSDIIMKKIEEKMLLSKSGSLLN
jgi:hypothetical protein